MVGPAPVEIAEKPERSNHAPMSTNGHATWLDLVGNSGSVEVLGGSPPDVEQVVYAVLVQVRDKPDELVEQPRRPSRILPLFPRPSSAVGGGSPPVDATLSSPTMNPAVYAPPYVRVTHGEEVDCLRSFP